ncbi:MAG: right-handed parallel beta-helix repeat-containing protein [Anaerolineales bacterium]|nr:right-handed parallel beta-helix repeat-containing protein [Anaerolineales bacterium]
MIVGNGSGAGIASSDLGGGIYVGGSDNIIVGNHVGVAADGLTKGANAGDGVRFAAGATGNRLGGSNPGVRNLISGNTGHGVIFAGASGNVMLGNYVGVDATGAVAMGNDFGGVWLVEGAQSNIVGSSTAGGRNIISGNTAQGVALNGVGTQYNQILGNFIGVDAAGQLRVKNSSLGIEIRSGASENSIGGMNASPGGACSGACNVISGNNLGGVSIRDGVTLSNTVSGNYVGMDVTGLIAIGNGPAADGIALRNGVMYSVIGGDSAGARNILSGNLDNGLDLDGAHANRIMGNYVGVDATGAKAAPNSRDGISLRRSAHDNVIGGATAGAGNVIGGNSGSGIRMTEAATANLVAGNLIGVSADGTAALPNGQNGVVLDGEASYNVIGGALAGERNVISGNREFGVVLLGTGVAFNRVAGNHIGTDAAGLVAIHNGVPSAEPDQYPTQGDGVFVVGGASDNLVGGDTAGARNLISGNVRDGVTVASTGSLRNRVVGNWIGTDVTGEAALGNGWNGVYVYGGPENTEVAGNVLAGNGWGIAVGALAPDSAPSGTVIISNPIGIGAGGVTALGNRAAGIYLSGGAVRTQIGSDAAGAGNRIANNLASGVSIHGAATLSNTISHTAIWDNGGQGIDLADGGNVELAAPTVEKSTAGEFVTGSACAGCRVELFSDKGTQGRVYEGATTAGADGQFTFVHATTLAGPYVTGTATDGAGNTSEFSIRAPVEDRLYLPALRR